MTKQMVVHSLGGILFSGKKEESTDTCNNIVESQKH